MAWREWEHAVGSSRVQATHHTEESCPDVFRRLKLDQAKSSCCVSAAGRKPKLEQTQESFESQWNWMTIDYCRYVDMYVYAFYTILYYTISYYTLLYSAILYTIDYILYAINNTLYTIYHILYTTYYIIYYTLYTIHTYWSWSKGPWKDSCRGLSHHVAEKGGNVLNNFLFSMSYGSRPKTHARFLVSEWHLQIWMCVFCCSGERPRKRGVRLRKVWISLFINKYISFSVCYSIHVWQFSFQNCHRVHVWDCIWHLYNTI